MRCKECDEKLWSFQSRDIRLCTECQEGEYTGPQDLEDMLEEMGYVPRGTEG